MTVGSMFTGIGGLDRGFEAEGFEVLWMCERDPFCRAALAKHWPGVPVYDDVVALDGRHVQRPDVMVGGFPCQDVSDAGQRVGLHGERSGLWAHFARLIGEIRPRFVVIENVRGLLSANGDELDDRCVCGWPRGWRGLPVPLEGSAPAARCRDDAASDTRADQATGPVRRNGVTGSESDREMGSGGQVVRRGIGSQGATRSDSPASRAQGATSRLATAGVYPARDGDSALGGRPSTVVASREGANGANSAGSDGLKPEGAQADDAERSGCPACGRSLDGADEQLVRHRAVGAVLRDLSRLGFDAEWAIVRASDVGAPQLRARVFIIGINMEHADLPRQGDAGEGDAGRERLSGRDAATGAGAAVADPDGRRREGRGLEESGGERGPRGSEPDGRGAVRELDDAAELGDAAALGRDRRPGRDRARDARPQPAHGGDDVSDAPGQGPQGCGPEQPSRRREPAALPADGGADTWRGWPARPGEPQHAWEPPRVLTSARAQSALGADPDGVPGDLPGWRRAALQAIGNAVVPQVGAVLARRVRELAGRE